jgi:phage RecT family recombinase
MATKPRPTPDTRSADPSPAVPPTAGGPLNLDTRATPFALKQYLSMRDAQAAVGALLQKAGLDPERFRALAVQALVRNPELQECTVFSVGEALAEAAELGLEPGSTVLSHCWLVPRKKKISRRGQGDAYIKVAQLMVGYRGEVAMFLRAGGKRAEAREICEHDYYNVELGTNPHIEHKLDLSKPRGLPIAYYAIAWLADGSCQFEIMSSQDVRLHAQLFAGDTPAWQKSEGEMAKKTVWRRLKKWLSLSEAQERAEEISADAREEGEVIIGGKLEDTPKDPVAATAKRTKLDAMVERAERASVTPAPAPATASEDPEDADPGPCALAGDRCARVVGHTGPCMDVDGFAVEPAAPAVLPPVAPADPLPFVLGQRVRVKLNKARGEIETIRGKGAAATFEVKLDDHGEVWKFLANEIEPEPAARQPQTATPTAGAKGGS